MLLLAFPPQRFRSMFKRYNLVPLVPKLDASVPIDSAPVDIIRAMTNTFLRATALNSVYEQLSKVYKRSSLASHGDTQANGNTYQQRGRETY